MALSTRSSPDDRTAFRGFPAIAPGLRQPCTRQARGFTVDLRLRARGQQMNFVHGLTTVRPWRGSADPDGLSLPSPTDDVPTASEILLLLRSPQMRDASFCTRRSFRWRRRSTWPRRSRPSSRTSTLPCTPSSSSPPTLPGCCRRERRSTSSRHEQEWDGRTRFFARGGRLATIHSVLDRSVCLGDEEWWRGLVAQDGQRFAALVSRPCSVHLYKYFYFV